LQLLEEDASRKAAFEHELNHIQDDLDRLKYRSNIPEDLSGAFVPVQVNALHVLTAMLDLVGAQLAYLKTFLAKFGTHSETWLDKGRVVLNIVTDSGKEYEDTGMKLRACVAKFDQSLMDAALEVGLGIHRYSAN
jgi:hypothetical protein